MKTVHHYRGLKIIEYADGRSGVKKFKARFQLKNKEYTPSKTSLEKLKIEINRIFTLVDEGKNPETETDFPFVSEVLNKELSIIANRKKHILYERVFNDFLSLIPPIRVDELTQADFESYITFRQKQINERTGKPIKNATINKELSAINVALENSPKRFRILHGFKPVKIEKLPDDYKPRHRTVKEDEFEKLFAYLYQSKQSGEREKDYLYRVRLGHWLEFKPLTGLRRKEIAMLKPEHYNKSEKALIDFERPKTGSEINYFPLLNRAAEIIEERLKICGEFIFTDDGLPIESHYRKLKNLARELNIKYGSFTKGGFVMHDLRRNFGTMIVRATDVETAREFLGHADLTHTGIYLTTDKDRMRAAVHNLDKTDLKDEITVILEQVKSGKLSIKKAVEKVLKITTGR